jgi:hypothetical protein
MALTKCKECSQTVSTEAYTCPHCGAPQRTAPPPIPPTIVVQPLAPEKKKGMGIFSGCLVIVLTIFIIGVISAIVINNGGSTSPSVGKTVAPNGESGTSSTVDLTAHVRFTGTQVVVQNGDTFDWTNVKLEINSGILSSGFILKVSRISGGQEYTVGAMQFAKPNGERFNPLTYKPQNFTISCNTPKGDGFYYGEWK